ncbi:MAG: ATP-binding cassette domain-containing protein [Oscillochloris sp.]|nr:ATP-binding cassette domain-containing protein [Oscillochloris sp.]
MPLLQVRDFGKRFDIHQLGRSIVAFEDVHFDLAGGEFLLLRGPNGAGKSTLLRCLYRTYLPSSGSATYAASGGTIDLATAADVDIVQLRRSDLGHVTQFLRPRPRVSAISLVSEPLRIAGYAASDAEREAAHWLRAFGLKEEIWSAYPSTFSGGEQQKVNLVRALIRPRRLLLLDEPTASLDQQARAALVDRLRELKSHGVTMIGVFHHPEDVLPLVDREYVLAAPKTVAYRNGREEAYVAD